MSPPGPVSFPSGTEEKKNKREKVKRGEGVGTVDQK